MWTLSDFLNTQTPIIHFNTFCYVNAFKHLLLIFLYNNILKLNSKSGWLWLASGPWHRLKIKCKLWLGTIHVSCSIEPSNWVDQFLGVWLLQPCVCWTGQKNRHFLDYPWLPWNFSHWGGGWWWTTSGASSFCYYAWHACLLHGPNSSINSPFHVQTENSEHVRWLVSLCSYHSDK